MIFEDQFSISDLIVRHLQGRLDIREQEALKSWIAASDRNKTFFEEFKNDAMLISALKEFNSLDEEAVWAKTNRGINREKRVSIRFNYRVIATAAAVAVMTLGVWLYYASNQSDHHINHSRDPLISAKDITPGKNGATITLANGKVIQLSDVKSGVVIEKDRLAYTDGSSVISDKESMGGLEVTAETTKGQTYTFTLPDGTKVWLNADSKISFAQSFVKTTREIFLEGEAYFEVATNKKVPFVVKSNRQQVEVLGTHFNINTYQDEAVVQTTLLEGSVRIEGVAKLNVQKTLLPGQQAVLTSNTLNVKAVDVNDAVAWKNGDFVFKNEPIESIMRKLSRWYNVEVSYEGEISAKGFNGKVSRSKNIYQVLKALESTKSIHFKVEGRRITAME